MKRNKIKPKYLQIINLNNNINNNDEKDNKISKIENTIIKTLISFFLITLMLFWGIIPSIILGILNINPENLSNTTIYIISFLNDLLFISLLIGLYHKSIKENFSKYFNKNFKTNFKTSLHYWLIGIVIMLASNYLIAILTNGQLAENEEAVRSLIDIAPLYMAFQLVIYAPLTEELIFRKSLKNAISNKWLFPIISGLIFGGLHAITSITDITSLLYLIPYCSLGITFGFLYQKTNNIFSTITIHALHNFLALIIYLITL